MFTLIKREIRDHIVYFIGAAVLSAIFIVISIPIISRYNSINRARYDQGEFSIGIGVPVTAIVVIGICGLGVSQMYLDRSRKISAFLSTLAVSRDAILSARIISGILVILTFLVPLTITNVVLLRLFVPPLLIYPGIVFEIFIAVFLMAFACYCIGLQTGWTSGR